jgi:hypothetical protein
MVLVFSSPEKRDAMYEAVWIICAFPAFIALMTFTIWIGEGLLPLERYSSWCMGRAR